MVRLHALKSVHKERPALEVDGALLDRDGTFGHAARPEGMSQGTPRVLHIRSEQGLACGADVETRGGTGNLEVDNGSLVVQALDGVKGAVLGQLDGAIVGVETRPILAELLVVERCRAPEVGLSFVRVKDLAVELAGCANAAVYIILATLRQVSGCIDVRHIAVDDLGKGDISVVAENVEALGLDRSRVHGQPLQVIALELSKGHRDSLVGNRLDGTGTVYGLLCTGDISQSRILKQSSVLGGLTEKKSGGIDRLMAMVG